MIRLARYESRGDWMAHDAKAIEVMIASPSDVAEERLPIIAARRAAAFELRDLWL